jgi:predicted dehydrogenase/threonine dehydrogenase-like Zn-dependent dehydrogenase
MKQLLQRFRDGTLSTVEAPTPAPTGVQILTATRASLISAGTERSLVEFGRANPLDKARQQPDKVRQVLAKVRTDGLGPTLDAVRSKLDDPIPLGYCSAGTVVAVGAGARGFRVGDRVVTNGPHGTFTCVPHTLAAQIPEGVSFENAAFTPLAAIGLQGLRLAQPTLGETIVVYGLGLIGLLTVQLARAHGCRVIGIDRDAARLELARGFGALPINGADGGVVGRVLEATGQTGADAVLLTLASASDEPVHEAAEMSRRRGRIVLVGVTGLQLRRDDFYRKELSFSVSCSYGPGRYDPAYEEQGRDYPVGFVRWTEQRNFEAVLQLMADGRLDPSSLVSHRFEFDDAERAYDLVLGGASSLGVVLTYDESAEVTRTVDLNGAAGAAASPVRAGHGAAGAIGAGLFAQRTLFPAMRAAGFDLRTLASAGGTSAAVAGRRFGFRRATTDNDAVLNDADVDTLFVLTRHSSHARLALAGLQAGKHVFVEKPLALTESDLDQLERAARSGPGLLTVGFNRRFAPLTQKLAAALRGRRGPAALIITVNAGALPPDHWTHDPEVGGGRILGEACHFIDLARAIVAAPIAGAEALPAHTADGGVVEDVAHISLRFADGSIAAIHYLANGASSFPKERVEVFCEGRTLTIDNWKRLREHGAGSSLFERSRRQDKGHAAEMAAWLDAVRGGTAPPIPYDELFEVSRWSVRLAEQVRIGPDQAEW